MSASFYYGNTVDILILKVIMGLIYTGYMVYLFIKSDEKIENAKIYLDKNIGVVKLLSFYYKCQDVLTYAAIISCGLYLYTRFS